MKANFNPRENGACPLCARAATCRVRAAIREAVAALGKEGEGDLEIVIYSCPRFQEKP